MSPTDKLLNEIESVLGTVLHIKNELLEIKKMEQLTQTEKEVYFCMQDGMNRREIAETLFKSEATIKKQVKSIKTKLQHA